jgi:hypothetical protein
VPLFGGVYDYRLWPRLCNIGGRGRLLSSRTDVMDSSRVEVSGWDAKEDFFVEKTSFIMEAEGRMEIALRSFLREGCVVFVRALEPFATGSSFPIAYQAVDIMGMDVYGRARVGLEQLRPRTFQGYTELALHPIAARVA